MDSTLLAVLIGALASIPGTLLTHWFTSRKEDKRWKRQQETEQRKLARDEERSRKQHLQELYQNCIYFLSLLVTDEATEQIAKMAQDDRLRVYHDAQRWLTLLSLHQQKTYYVGGPTFHYYLKQFTEHSTGSAAKLREEVLKLVMDDIELFPKPIEEAQKINETKQPVEKRVKFQIDEEFRRQQLLKGVQLPLSFVFTCKLSTFTPGQRKKLLDMYFDTNKDIPSDFSLLLPIFHTRLKRIVLGGATWKAQLNPYQAKPQEILKEWERAYNEQLEKAKNECDAKTEEDGSHVKPAPH